MKRSLFNIVCATLLTGFAVVSCSDEDCVSVCGDTMCESDYNTMKQNNADAGTPLEENIDTWDEYKAYINASSDCDDDEWDD